ncbi:MAG: hypothetical protein ACP5ER_01030 [Candidatus Bathyarchaeales archaeon]
MAVFVHVCENFGDLGSAMRPGHDADKLNAMLETLKQKGAKILDIKVSVCAVPSTKMAATVLGTCRIYLIIYEAQTRLL